MSKLNFSANKLESTDNKLDSFEAFSANPSSAETFPSSNVLYEVMRNIYSNVFPIGYVLTTFDDTDYSNYLGFTWESLDETFLFASETRILGATGGEQSHKLTIDELPNHYHQGLYYSYVDDTNMEVTLNSGSRGYRLPWTPNAGLGGNAELISGTTGSGHYHNNMPPYTVVRMWRRIA